MSDPRLFETDGPTEHVRADDPQDVYAKLIDTPGMEMGFEITRVNPDPKTSFSQEALTTLQNQIQVWIGTRIIRQFKEKGRGAQRMQVHVIVSLDGAVPPPVADVPFISFPDSQHRTKRKK